MDKNKLQAEYPELHAELIALGAAEAQAKFSEKETELTGQVKSLETELSERDKRILALEKDNEIRKMAELKQKADSIWAAKLSESDLPKSSYEKVVKHVIHSDFVKEGVFNEEDFVTAVDAEIKDWESRGFKQSVLGTGFTQTQKDIDAEAQTLKAKEDKTKETVGRLLSYVGKKQ